MLRQERITGIPSRRRPFGRGSVEPPGGLLLADGETRTRTGDTTIFRDSSCTGMRAEVPANHAFL
jgi:hypothetical protein